MENKTGVPVRPADETREQFARCVAAICHAALDEGAERETLEKLAVMCEAVGTVKTNGHTKLSDREILEMTCNRVVTALKMTPLTGGQLAAAVEREEGR